MGCGLWSDSSFRSYSSSRGRDVDSDTGILKGNLSVQEMYTQYKLSSELNPLNVVRECCESEEHPNALGVILALDVTGSMGSAATDVAKKLNYVMTELYKQVKDVQFMIMGIGDLAYDSAPIQISQFESDIRIAEQLDKIYFEAGGGGNSFESYTAAWYMGSRHCKLDSWKRNKKGIIITMGDELINPYLPQRPLSIVTGDSLQGDVETDDLYKEASKKYSIYHLNVEHGGWNDSAENVASFSKVLGVDKVFNTNIDNIADKIIKIISKEYEKNHDVIKPTTPNDNQNQTQETVFGFESGIRW